MLDRFSYWLASIVFIALLITSVFVNPVAAVVDSCIAEVSPQLVSPGTQNDFQFRLVNNSNDTIRWIKVTRPSANFSISGGSAAGWSSSTNASAATLTGGTQGGGEMFINLIATSVNVEASNADWSVEVSDDAGGASPTGCNGSLGTTISNEQAPIISNININNLTPTSVKINWATSEPATSQVHWGLTDNYGGSTPRDDNFKTQHSVSLGGLEPNTGYHYRVVSVDPVGYSNLSGDNTFLTPTIPPEDSGPTEDLPKAEIPLKPIPTEKISPQVFFDTLFNKPFKQAPKITGRATDNESLAGIEYSADGGQNWLPVDAKNGLGTKSATFEFTPINLDDGNYQLLARAIDTSANIGVTQPVTMVIDRLEPIASPPLVSVGPQILEPDNQGAVVSQVGVDQKITLSAVGGPISININVQKDNAGQNDDKNFTLTQSSENGLWSGIMSFEEAGLYKLIVQALDGAGNNTSREFTSVNVASASKIFKAGTSQPVEANLTIYYLDPHSNSWVVWDGPAYGQLNPQKADEKGTFSYFLPPGTYYIKAATDGYHDAISNIFKLDESKPISTKLEMKLAKGFSLGRLHLYWPDFSSQKITVDINANQASSSKGTTELVKEPLPDFTLPDVTGKIIHSVEWLGKPTILVIAPTWAPSTTEEAGSLRALSANKDINVLVVAAQENAAKARVFNTISGYELNWLADPDSTLTGMLDVQSIPTHYFVDRRGIVNKVVGGVLSEKELMDHLGGL